MKFLVLLVAVLAVGVSDLPAKIFAKKSAHKFFVFFSSLRPSMQPQLLMVVCWEVLPALSVV